MSEISVSEQFAERVLDGKYKLVEPLGEGGMAIVFKSIRLRIGDDVAVKILRNEMMLDVVSQARFEREAQAAARIKHPNVVTIHDFGTSSCGLTYLVMELLNGPTLESELRRYGQLSIDRAIAILLPVCQAIGAAHQEGIIHRDLKPSNILLHRLKDGQEIVKVVDFGIVKIGRSKERLTQVNNLLGTPHYMSPEQCCGKDLDARSDVYALGVIAYELLTGQIPFDRESLLEILQAQVKEPPLPPRQIRSDITAQVEAAVLRALNKQPEQRPVSASAFAQELAAAAGIQPSSARQPGPASTAGGTSRLRVSDPNMSSFAPARTTIHGDLRTRETISRKLVKEAPDFDAFIGRHRESERLGSEYHQLLSGRARPIVIMGEQGVGLSRLGDEFKRWVRHQGGFALLTNFYEPAGQGQLPFHVWLDLLRRVAGVPRKDVLNDQALCEAISDRSGAELPVSIIENRVSSEAEKWRTFEAISSVLLRMLGDRSAVLIFDDLHYSDALSYELLSYLLRNCRTRIMFLFLARSEQATQKGHSCQEWLAALSRSGGYEALKLQQLTEQEVRYLLDSIFGRLQMAGRDIERFWKVSQGNPYYVCEIVRLLLNEGRISLGDDEQWHCENISDLTLPESLHQLADLKLARLDPKLVELLGLAAVIGREFSFDLLESVSETDEDSIADGLEKAVKEDIIDESDKRDEEFYFHDPTLHLVLYESIARRKRRKLHLQVAQAIEDELAAHPKKLAAQSARLLHHYHQAGQNEKIFHYGRAAAEAARSRLALAEAETYYGWALEAGRELADEGAAPDSLEWAELYLGTAETVLHLGRLDEAETALFEAHRLAKSLSNGLLVGRAELIQSQLEFNRSAFERSLAAAELGLVEAQKAGDAALEGKLLLMMARVCRSLGQYDEALDALECNLEIARQLGDRATESQVLSLLGWMVGFAGNFREGLNFIEEALKTARSHKDRFGEMMGLLRMGQVHMLMSQIDPALEAFEVGLELARTLESRLLEGSFQSGLGDVYRAMSEMELARDCYQQYMAIAQVIGNQSGEAAANHNLGLVALELGILPDAEKRLKEALSDHDRLGEPRLAAEAHFALGEVYEQVGKPDESRKSYESALELCRRIGHPDCEWRTLYGLANALLTEGDADAAREMLQEAVEIIEGLREALPLGANKDDFMEERQKVFSLLEDIRE